MECWNILPDCLDTGKNRQMGSSWKKIKGQGGRIEWSHGNKVEDNFMKEAVSVATWNRK